MSMFGLPVHLAYLNMLLLQTYVVDAGAFFAIGLSLSAFYSIAKLVKTQQ